MHCPSSPLEELQAPPSDATETVTASTVHVRFSYLRSIYKISPQNALRFAHLISPSFKAHHNGHYLLPQSPGKEGVQEGKGVGSDVQAAGLAGRKGVQRTFPRASRSVVCAAAPQDLGEKWSKVAASTVAAAALAAVASFGMVDEAKADIAGLTPCAKSKQYARKQKKEINALQRRMEKVG